VSGNFVESGEIHRIPVWTHKLRFEGGDGPSERSVPASVLAEALTQAQRVVHLLAMAYVGRPPPRQRLRVPRDFERLFPVVCTPATPGSFVQPIAIGAPRQTLFSPGELEEVSDRFDAVLDAVVRGDAEQLNRVVPDRWYRRAVVESVSRMPPRPSTGMRLSVSSQRRLAEPFRLSDARLQIDALLLPPSEEPAREILGERSIIGSLSAIDFGERKLTLLDPTSHKEINCFYVEDAEPLLLANPRELIQVTGQVLFDAQGDPVKVVETKDIREVDLEPVAILPFTVDNLRVKPRRPRLVEPRLDETSQLFLLQDDEIGIDLVAETRAALEEDLAALLPHLWRSYAHAPEVQLARDARLLKARLLAAFEEMPNAAEES